MPLRQPGFPRNYTPFPYTTLFRCVEAVASEIGAEVSFSSDARPEAVATPGLSRRGVSHSPELGTKSMEQMLWDAACQVRGEKDAPKFKDYLLPLLFIKRLSDVFDDEVQRLTETYGDRDTALPSSTPTRRWSASTCHPKPAGPWPAAASRSSGRRRKPPRPSASSSPPPCAASSRPTRTWPASSTPSTSTKPATASARSPTRRSRASSRPSPTRSEEHTSELQSIMRI